MIPVHLLRAILALSVTQATGTAAAADQEIAGASLILRQAMKDVIDGTRTATRFGNGNTACIPPVSTIPAGAKVVRFQQAILSPRGQRLLGMAAPTGGWANATDVYVTIEVQSATGTHRVRDVREVELWDDPGDDDGAPEARTLTTPSQPTCEVAIRRKGSADALGYRCACSSGASCTWTNPDPVKNPSHATSAAPLHRTLPPESLWTGSGCVEKPCMTRAQKAGDETWPAECP